MKRTSIFTIMILVTMVLAGCNLPFAGPSVQPTMDQNALNTAVAETVAAVSAAETAAAPANSPTPEVPSDTPAPPTATNSPEPSSTIAPPTATINPGVPMINATTDTNCRWGPGPDYGAIGYFLKTDGSVPVKGRNSSNSWWVIAIPKYNYPCWAWGGSTSVQGDVNALPVVNPPSITVGVGASPSDYTGACPVTITFTSTLTSNGPTTYTYQFELQSGGSFGKTTVSSTGAGSVGGSATKDFGVDTTDKVRVHLLSPQSIASGWKSFKVNCP
jgi:hypothetical protein